MFIFFIIFSEHKRPLTLGFRQHKYSFYICVQIFFFCSEIDYSTGKKARQYKTRNVHKTLKIWHIDNLLCFCIIQ